MNLQPRINCKTILSSFFILLLFLSTSVDAKILLRKTEGNKMFEVHDRGSSKFSRMTHRNLYMSIKFDLVTGDVGNMVEPEGITTIHIAHYNNKELIDLIKTTYIDRIYNTYNATHRSVQRRMRQTNKKINKITLNTDSSISRGAGQSTERKQNSNWRKIDRYIDQMTSFYSTERDQLVTNIDTILEDLYGEDKYKSAEVANAKYKIRMTRIKELGLGVFSIGGAATRIAYGDVASIVTIVKEAKNLLAWCKNNLNRGIDNLYDDYTELEESLNALQRAFDEGRISAGLSRVEKAYVSYVKISKKFDTTTIEKLVNIEQFFDQIREMEDAIERLRTEETTNREATKQFIQVKKKLNMLRNSQEQIVVISNLIKESLTNANTIRLRKNRLVRKKETQLKLLRQNRSRFKRSTKGFVGLLSKSLDQVENVLATLSYIEEWSLKD